MKMSLLLRISKKISMKNCEVPAIFVSQKFSAATWASLASLFEPRHL